MPAHYYFTTAQREALKCREFCCDMSTSVPVSSILILPSYIPLPAEFVDAMRNMASAPNGAATEQGGYFLMAIAERRDVSTLLDGDYIVVPLLTLAQDQVAYPTFMATAPIMFLKLVGIPHAVMTFCMCSVRWTGHHSTVKLPSMSTYFIARRGVVEALAELLLLSTSTVVNEKRRRKMLSEQPGNQSLAFIRSYE